MPEVRYLEAEMIRLGTNPDQGDVVEIPLTDRDPDVPAVLSSPLPDFSGVWHLDSSAGQHPSVYVQVES